MKNLLLCLAFLSSAVLADSFDSLELQKLPVGSSISFSQNVLIQAGETYNDFSGCDMTYEASDKNRQLTSAHSLVLTKIDSSKYEANVAYDCTDKNDDDTCDHEERDVADYELFFAVYKDGKPSASASTIAIRCLDESGKTFLDIAAFKKILKQEHAALTVKNDAIDF